MYYHFFKPFSFPNSTVAVSFLQPANWMYYLYYILKGSVLLSNPKSIRNAFIRVTAQNNTANGLVEYTLDDIKKMTASLAERYIGTKYALICHDRDTNPDGAAPTHFHIFMKFKNPIHFRYVKEVFPYGKIEQARSANATVQYLIHKNNPEKAQYQKDQIIGNFPQDEFDAFFINDKKVARLSEADELEQVLQDISENRIRRFNMSDYISVQLYSKYRRQIENAFHYRDLQFMVNPRRDIQVIFVTGDTGNGKTVFAQKAFCTGYQGVCVSSSSNDPLQDYTDQDVLILDDLRDDDFKFQDLLKILDPHTGSSVKSRYNNKVFMGKCIIITSYKKLSDWYSKVPDDAKRQLYRRINLYVEVEKKEIFIYEVDEHLKKELKISMQNAVPALLAQKHGGSQEAFLDGAVQSYYGSLSGDLPDEEIQAGLATVKRNGTIPPEELPF